MDEKGAANRLSDLYGFYRKKYVMMVDGNVVTRVSHLSGSTFLGHVYGNYALAVFAGPRSTKFITFDVDVHDPELVRSVMAALEHLGIPREYQHVSTSGGKGYHIDVFFDCFVYNSVAKNLYSLVIDLVGCTIHDVEFRPTNTQSIKLPLTRHYRTGNYCWFLDRDTLDSIETLDYLDSIVPFHANDIAELVRIGNRERWYRKYAECIELCDDDAQPVQHAHGGHMDLDRLPQVERVGTRHNLMAKIAAKLRVCGYSEDSIHEQLMDWYEAQDKSLISSCPEEVEADAYELAAWAWSDTFHMPERAAVTYERRERHAVLRRRDIRYILAGGSYCGHLLMFFLLVKVTIYGRYKISVGSLSQIVGCTDGTISECISAIKAKRLIDIKSGGMVMRNGKMHRVVNEYARPEKLTLRYPDRSDVPVDECNVPDICEANIRDEYFRFMTTMCADDYLRKNMRPSEYADCSAWKEKMQGERV